MNAGKAASADSGRGGARCIGGSARNVRKGAWSDECPCGLFSLQTGGVLLARLFISDCYLPKLLAAS